MTDTFVGDLPVARDWRDSAAVRFLQRFGFVIAAYAIAMIATRATTMGDSADYVESITLFSRGIDHWMWDFAHLFWRPFGWLLSRALFGPGAGRIEVMLTLTGISRVAGLACVLLTHAIAQRMTGRAWIANTTAIALTFTRGFLNFAQAGTSYVLALALVLAGIYAALEKRDVIAGIAFALAVCFWIPYMLAIPAALGVRRLAAAFKTALTFALTTAIAYAVAVTALGLHSIASIKAWIAWSSHGTDFGGPFRTIFGFARTFIDMGADGALFKRYLLHDPFNPVSLQSLAVASLWKLALFYVFILVVAVAQSRRNLALLLAGALPTLLFAVRFAGSDMERYFPLYPAIFFAIACALATRARWFIVAFAGVLIVVNTGAMSASVARQKENAAASRIADLVPRLDDRSLVIVPNWQDDLVGFARAHPFHPINRSGRLHVSALVTPGTAWNTHWREDFASNVLTTWNAGGAVWVSRRALSARPHADWNWTEGDDRRVSWTDFPQLFAHLQLGESSGSSDGFVLLSKSPLNTQSLTALAHHK